MATESGLPETFQPPLEPGQGASITWSRAFPATLDQVGKARRFLAGLLAGGLLADDAILCLSEICANAIQHSRSARPGGSFIVRVTRTAGLLRIEVDDEGGSWGQCPGGEPERGRGLVIVEQLAAAWGISPGYPAGRSVWFELKDS